MTRALALCALLLAGCTAANDAADAIARAEAKRVVNDVVARNFPGVDAAPITDCIIDAASAGEILSVASDSVTGVTDRTVSLVLEIAQRPEAANCIAEAGIRQLLL